MDNVQNAVTTIENDFRNQRAPFDDVTFPEERLLMEVDIPNLSMEDRLALFSMFSTLDYNRDANQLVDNLLELQNSPEKKWFDAWKVPLSEKSVEYRFKEIGFRYPSRDAHAWVTNCDILRNNYHGRWSELLLDAGCDAPTLVERLEADDFLCLKGVKIAPMYARIIDDEVCDLSNLWELDIPVDTHIRRLSQDLFSDLSVDLSDDVIREQWRGLAIETDIDRTVVDGALWHIGNKWDEWGKDYWDEVTA